MRKLKSAALIAISLGAILGGAVHAQTIPGVSDDQIRTFFASSPDNNQIQDIARSLNLNAAQLAQAMAIGRGANLNTMPASIASAYFDSARNMLGQDDGAKSVFTGEASSFYSPTLGRGVSEQEIRDFYDTKPTREQLLAKAAQYGTNIATIDRTATLVGYDQGEGRAQPGYNVNDAGYATNKLGQVVRISDPGAMYSSDPTHKGLDSYFNGDSETGLVNNPAIPSKKWVNVSNR